MVPTSTLAISIALLLFGGWTAIWLLYCMLQPILRMLPGGKTFLNNADRTRGHSSSPSNSAISLFTSGKGFSERWRFRRCSRALEDIDRALIAQNSVGARKLFPRALFLDWIQDSPELIAKSSHHHLDLLNKLIILAELENGTIRNLPKLETLLSQRGELLTSAFETRVARKRFKEKQKQKGKNPPKWSTKEFDTRLNALEKEVQALNNEILKEMKGAIDSLGASSARKKSDENENQYH